MADPPTIGPSEPTIGALPPAARARQPLPKYTRPPGTLGNILDIHNPWRDAFLPASFRNAQFYCEANSREGGRRHVQHEFPKRDMPYGEDMGRRAVNCTVRGYCICYRRTNTTLQNRDYRIARDLLLNMLEDNSPGLLILPFAKTAMFVTCTQYRLTEEDKLGGYCVFDMTFAEKGLPPILVTKDTLSEILTNSQVLADTATNILNGLEPPPPPPPPDLGTGFGGGQTQEPPPAILPGGSIFGDPSTGQIGPGF